MRRWTDFKRLPFSHYILIAILVLILSIVIGITIVDYQSAEKNLRTQELLLREQTENTVDRSFRIIDTGLKMFDNTLNRQMALAFEPFLEEYQRSGGDPSQMDLHRLKQEIDSTIVSRLSSHMAFDTVKAGSVGDSPSGGIDLYIINASGVIEYATYAPDIGLDFKTLPSTYGDLTRIRISEGFFPDRVVQEGSGRLRKFAYMPTPDHRYILELGLVENVFIAERGQLKYTDVTKDIKSHNPFVEEIRIFSAAKRQVGNSSFILDSNLSILLDRIFEKRETLELPPTNGRTVKYLYINLSDPQYVSDMSLVVEVTYNNALILAALNELLLFHFLVAIVALGAAFGSAFLISRHLTLPIRNIVADVDSIARGNLNRAIAPTMGEEFAVMESSINAMVENLKTTIHRLQESEANVKISEERYRAVVESQNEFITRFRPDGTHLFANEAYCRYFGVSCDQIIGQQFFPRIPEEDQQRLEEHFISLTQENPAETIEHRITMPNGEIRWQQWDDRAIFDHAGNLLEYQSVGRDITARKRAEEELKNLYSELEHRVAERTIELQLANQELESFSYSVSHDLRAPLRAIDGFSRILLEEHAGELTPEDLRYLHLIRKNSQQMAQLIDALLNFSRMGRQSLNKERLDPTVFAREALEGLSDEMKGRDVKVSIADLPPCEADRSMLRQVFDNLLSNALKFTRKREHATIEIGFYQEDHHPVYYIRDNGVGFDMRYQDKLFKVFQRLHPNQEYEGTGVGLAIVQRIIQRHGGNIWATSVLNEGTTFFFTLDEEV